MLGFNDLASLNKLLQTENREDEDILDKIDKDSTAKKFDPGSIGSKVSNYKCEKLKENKCENKNDIWDSDEIIPGSEYTDIYDSRSEPEYSIYFKQDLNTSDIYLGTTNKTPSSSSCEYLVVKISLPNTKYDQINLDVKEKYLDLRTPNRKLGLHLPNPVDPNSGSAKWNADKGELEVTLTNKREYDFINF